MQNSLKLQIQLAACSEQKEKTIWGFNSTLQWLKLPKFTNIQQKTRVWFHLSLGKKNRRFSCPRRLGWAFTAAAEASNTSEGPDEKVEASFRHSPVAPPQKKGVLNYLRYKISMWIVFFKKLEKSLDRMMRKTVERKCVFLQNSELHLEKFNSLPLEIGRAP